MLSRWWTIFPWAIVPQWLPEAHFHQADIGDLAALRAVFQKAQPKAILHFAGRALVGESMERPLKYFQNNTANPLNLLHCAAEFGVGKFIFSSTCSTYGIPETIPITETTPQCPVNPYGDSKRMFEQLLKWHSEQSGTEAVIFRYFNAAGATAKLGEHHDPETHLIPRILQTALGLHESFSIFGTDHPTPDGTCVRDYIHVSDLAEAHLLALRLGITGDYNLGRGHGDSVLEVLQACREITGHPIPAEDHPARAGTPPPSSPPWTKPTSTSNGKPATSPSTISSPAPGNGIRPIRTATPSNMLGKTDVVFSDSAQ
jgi:UDP-glucose 4-epimerase